jgi:hypothetical protein
MTTSLAPADGPIAAVAATTAAPPEPDRLHALDHRLRVFGDASRWATLTLGLLVGIITGPVDLVFLIVSAAFVGSAALQRSNPIRLDPPAARAQVRVALELVLVALGVAATDATHSPFVLTPMTAMVLAGYVWGDRLRRGTAVSAGVASAFTLAMIIADGEPSAAANLGLVFLLCGMLGAFGRSFLVEVEV